MSAITAPHLCRLEDLARAGLSDRAVAAVLNLDHDLTLSRAQVRYYRLRYTTARHPYRNPELPRVEA